MLRAAIGALLMFLVLGRAYAAITFKQSSYNDPQSAQSIIAVTYSSAQTAGDLNVVVVGWADATSSVSSVTDSKGNAYTLAIGPTVSPGVSSQSIYYARNIVAAAAGSNVVTVTFSPAVSYPDIRILEYSGVDTVSPLHATAGSNGTSATSSSGALSVTVSNALLVAANYVQFGTSGAGTSFTSRMITTDSQIVEDRVVTATGSYTGTAPLTQSGWWIMQMAAFRAASSDTQAPTTPTGVGATAASSTQINLSWTASTDNVGVTGYQIDRCQGASCSTFAQIGTSATTTFSSTGLTASTSYSYRVRATDAAGNVSANSATATATTQTAPDTTPPTAPSTISATVMSSTQLNLSWSASTDNVGVTGYQVDRCQGAACSTFAQIGTSATTTFSNTGLTASTSYSYRVRATDAAGNVSANSSTVTTTTSAPPDTTAPSAPNGLGANATGSTQINLTWTASTDNVGVAGYQIDRCQGASCSTFAQIGTPATTSFSDTGLTASTSYSYRARATDAAGNVSANSSTVSATTPVPPPSAPVKLSAVGAPGPQTSLTWMDTSGGAATGFKIERKLGPSGTYAQIATTAATVTTFVDTGVTAGTVYFYRLRATNAGGDSAYSSEAGAATPIPDVTASSTITYRYDPFGNLTQTNAGGVITNITYDLRGRKKTMSDPDMGNWTYDYDALSEMIRQTDANGNISTMGYDLLGRMKTRDEPDLHSIWTYDSCSVGVGKLCQVSTDNGFLRTFAYDSVGRLQTLMTNLDSAYYVSYGYDSASRLDTVGYPDSFYTKNVYNVFGYLSEVDVGPNPTNNPLFPAPGTRLWRAQSLTAAGNVLQEFLGSTSAITDTRAYDVMDRLASSSVSSSAGALQGLTFTYDLLGNLTQRVDSVNGINETFGYDNLNRLTLASGTGASGPLVTRSTDYDVLGNITYKSDAGLYTYGAKPHAVATVSGSVNASYTYDANGNMTSGAGRTLTYMSFNMPKTIGQGGDLFQYRYNADHERTRLDVTRATGIYTTLYLHPSGGDSLLYERDIQPNGTIEQRHYINGMGLVGVYVTDTQNNAGMRYFHEDHLKSITAISNDAGAPQERLAYEAFGKRRFPNGTADPNNTLIGMTTERGYTEHEHLDEVQLIHMNGRVYDPLLGRFMTPDPTVPKPYNLQSLNRYAYALNNPLKLFDPSGFDEEEPIDSGGGGDGFGGDANNTSPVMTFPQDDGTNNSSNIGTSTSLQNGIPSTPSIAVEGGNVTADCPPPCYFGTAVQTSDQEASKSFQTAQVTRFCVFPLCPGLIWNSTSSGKSKDDTGSDDLDKALDTRGTSAAAGGAAPPPDDDNSKSRAQKREEKINSILNDKKLPTEGFQYEPPKNWNPSEPLPRGPNGGYLDKFGNEWTNPRGQIQGERHWDVQLPDGRHVNVLPDGSIPH